MLRIAEIQEGGEPMKMLIEEARALLVFSKLAEDSSPLPQQELQELQHALSQAQSQLNKAVQQASDDTANWQICYSVHTHSQINTLSHPASYSFVVQVYTLSVNGFCTVVSLQPLSPPCTANQYGKCIAGMHPTSVHASNELSDKLCACLFAQNTQVQTHPRQADFHATRPSVSCLLRSFQAPAMRRVLLQIIISKGLSVNSFCCLSQGV